MIRNNAPFEVMVLSSETKYMAAAGKRADDLQKNEWSVFDQDSNLSVTPDDARKSKRIYFGLRDSTGKLRFFGDPEIKLSNVLTTTIQKNVEPKASRVTGHFTKYVCNREYSMRLVFSGGIDNYGMGRMEETLTISSNPAPCFGTTSQSLDPNELNAEMFKKICLMADKYHLKVGLSDPSITITSAKELTATVSKQIDNKVAALHNASNPSKPKGFMKITISQLESDSPNTANNSGLNMRYQRFVPSKITMSLSDDNGFGCGVVEYKDGIIASGYGRDMQQLEKIAAGWTQGDIYRMGNEFPLTDVVVYSKPDKFYDIFTLEYEIESNSGWLKYHNAKRLLILSEKDSGNLISLEKLTKLK